MDLRRATERLFNIMTSPFLKDKDRIFENAVGFVIYDKFPVNKGHCLIVPKREYADYFDSTKEEIEGLNKLLFQTKDFIKKNTIQMVLTLVLILEKKQVKPYFICIFI